MRKIAAKSERLDGLDVLKCICAFLVISRHTPFRGAFGANLQAITGSAVPIFFMITGFFYDSAHTMKKKLGQIKKHLILCVSTNILYIAWSVLLTLHHHLSVWEDLRRSVFSPIRMLKMLFFNTPLAINTGGHLWYLNAILYVLIVYFAAKKFGFERLIGIAAPILFVLNAALGKYSLLIFGFALPPIVTRNFLLVGIPCFWMGNFIGTHRKTIESLLERKKWLPVVLTAAFTAMVAVEYNLLTMYKCNAETDYYFFNFPLAACAFILFMQIKRTGGALNMLRVIGKDYSADIYILHPIAITLCASAAARLGINAVYGYVRPIAVFFASLLAARTASALRKSFKRLRARQ